MEKINLYFDCDGVIFDTIEEARKMAKEMGLNPYIRAEFDRFFLSVDWFDLMCRAGVINDAIKKIRIINNTGKYNVYILTKLSGNKTEEEVKRKVFSRLLPDIPVITLLLHEHKDEKVNPIGNILVEDDIRNFNRWNTAKGICVLFDRHLCDYNKNIVDDILNFEQTSGVKKLIKTRNYQENMV